MLATYEDSSVEPMCEKCYAAATSGAVQAEKARDHLKTIFKPEYHNYIDTKLAGDFAVELSGRFKSIKKAFDGGEE